MEENKNPFSFSGEIGVKRNALTWLVSLATGGLIMGLGSYACRMGLIPANGVLVMIVNILCALCALLLLWCLLVSFIKRARDYGHIFEISKLFKDFWQNKDLAKLITLFPLDLLYDITYSGLLVWRFFILNILHFTIVNKKR